MADAALQALGAVFITKPDFMLDEQPKAVVRAALQPAAPPLLKTRALLNLTELLKVQPNNHLLWLDALQLPQGTRCILLHTSITDHPAALPTALVAVAVVSAAGHTCRTA